MPGGRISFKGPEVRVAAVHPRVFSAIAAAGEVYGRHGVNLVVTSISDGQHRVGSYHYTGRAVDLRTHNVPQEDRAKVAAELRAALGAGYDVIHEKVGEPSEHIHVEWDPKP
jgi:hypothetical protein